MEMLPSIALFSVLLLTIQKIYLKLRPKFSVKVNCWFCNNNTSVPYNSSNSWYCPSCDQYNGFMQDGSYNRFLPEQFDEKLNRGPLCTKIQKKSLSPNGLCRFCNINLELKVRQLAQFVPINKEHYDDEVQQYSDQLERVYKLCSRCQEVLKKTLDKQSTLIASQNKASSSTFNHPMMKIKEKERHDVYLFLTAALSVGLLFSVMPYDWVTHVMATYPLPPFAAQVLAPVQEYVSKGLVTTMLLVCGVVVQLFDCAYMRDSTSFVNLLLWIMLLSLTRVPVKVDGLVTIVHVLAGVVFFITSITEKKGGRPKVMAAVKPVQLQRLDRKPEPTKRSPDLKVEESPHMPPHSPKSPVSDTSPVSNPSKPIHFSSREPSPEDFGLGKLNVSSRRVTRSQTKHFQTKQFGSQGQNDLFKPKPFNLTPPKLHFDNSEVQLPLTRSSSMSSGFVSLSQQREFEYYRTPSPSVLADEIESVSQCGNGTLVPYQSPIFQPTPYPQPFGVPFSNFQPYTVMHFGSHQLNRLYPSLPNMLPYEPSLNLSTSTLHRNEENTSWISYTKSAFSSLMFIFLITSNIAILWKVFGENYFNSKV